MLNKECEDNLEAPCIRQMEKTPRHSRKATFSRKLFIYHNKLPDNIRECNQAFLKALLQYLLEYLPIEDKIINLLDFVDIPQNSTDFKDKVLIFNDTWNCARR